MQVGIAVCIYVTGWGATLALGFVFGAAESIRVVGSRAARPAGVFTIVSIAAGEILVGVGRCPSLLPQPQGHGLAVLEAVGAAMIIALLGWATAEKERVEESVRRSEERFRALVQHGSDVIMVIDLDGAVLYVSPSIGRALGYDADAITRLTIDFIDEADPRARLPQGRSPAGSDGEAAWMEVRLRHANGSLRWFEVGVTNRLDDPSVDGMVCNMRDVTERKGVEAELAHRAHHDSLTSLPNRASFLTRLDGALAAATDSGGTVAVLFLDVDRFKLVNDSLGHDAGDRLLFDVANRLRACVRPQDVVARFGGDEFTLLLDDIEHAGAAIAIAQRITEVLRAPARVRGPRDRAVGEHRDRVVDRGPTRPATCCATPTSRCTSRRTRAARAGSSSTRSARRRWVERLELEGELWQAIDHDELIVRFQPEFSLTTGEVVAAEALVRWQHPTRAARARRLHPVRRGVEPHPRPRPARAARGVPLRAVVGAARPGERVVVSVNLSPRFIRQPDVVADITATLREVDADPRCLQIEITERTALTDVDRTVETLEQLRRLGVRVAIDDFGTGYSSLGYLKRLPIDVVKLDRSFVESMDVLESDVAIVQAVITMGHALGMKVTAEGVERVEQAARLRRLGCDTAMGFYWTSAVDADDDARHPARRRGP